LEPQIGYPPPRHMDHKQGGSWRRSFNRHFDINWSSDIDKDTTSIKAVGINGTVNIDTLFGFSDNFTRNNIEICYEGKTVKAKKLFTR